MTGRHKHGWKWDRQHFIPETWWDAGHNGIRSPMGTRCTDEIYVCECGAWMMSAKRLTLDEEVLVS
jgi:hypothetical protein